MSKRHLPKNTSLQSRKVAKHTEESNERKLPPPNESKNDSDSDDGNDATFQSAATNSDQSEYSFDYSDTPQTEKGSRGQLSTTSIKYQKQKESSSTQNEQRNESSTNKDTNMAVMVTTNCNEDNAEHDLITSSISIGNHQASNSSGESNRVESQTPQRPRKMSKPKKNMYQLIAAYKQTTTNLIPKLSFRRLSVQILHQHGDYRCTKEALNAIQESSELYLTHLFEDSYRMSLHRNRVTLKPIDMELVLYLRTIRNT